MEQPQIPVLLRVTGSFAYLMLATLAAVSGVQGSSMMAWFAFLLLCVLGIGIAMGKFILPSMCVGFRYWASLSVFFAVIGYVGWLVVGKLIV